MSVASPSTEPAAAPAAGLADVPWVHRTAAGTAVGGEKPPARADSVFLALPRAIAESVRVRRTLWLLVERDWKARYRAQALGMLWSFANPLIMMGVLSLVFVKVMRIQTPHFPVMFLIGQLLWQLFNNSMTGGTASLVDSAQIVKRTIYPRQLVPIAVVLSHLLNLALEAVILVVFVFIFPDAFKASPWLLLLPVVIGIEVVMLFGATMLTSVLNVIYRDMFYVVNSLLVVLFWATPVVYRIQDAPDWLRTLLVLNPLTGVIASARRIVMEGLPPEPAMLLPAAAAALVIFCAGALVFRRFGRVVSDHL